jgi:hypothetical protein
MAINTNTSDPLFFPDGWNKRDSYLTRTINNVPIAFNAKHEPMKWVSNQWKHVVLEPLPEKAYSY